MLNISYNTTQKITFNLAPSLVSPIYLFSLVNYTTRTRYNFISAELSGGSNLLQFSVTEVGEGSQSVLTGDIKIESFGKHTLEVYEQTSTTNLDHEQAAFLGEDEVYTHKEVVFITPPIRNDISVPEPACTLSILVSSTNESLPGASDGTASVTISGEQGGTTVLWSTLDGSIVSGQEDDENLTGLPDGTYTVIVSDDFATGCTASKSVTVNEPPACAILITGITTTAPTTQNGSDGTATVVVTGNAGAVNYTFSDGQTGVTATGLNEGDITAFVTDSGVGATCTDVFTATVPSLNNNLAFDGIAEYLDVSLDMQTEMNLNGDMSFSAWIKFDSLSGFQAICADQSSGGGSGNFSILANNDKISIICRVFVLTSTANLSTGTWMHFVYTRGGETGNWDHILYLDAIEDSSTIGSSANPKDQEGCAIGRGGQLSSFYLDGEIKGVSFWSRTLSTSDVTAINTAGANANAADLGISGLVRGFRLSGSSSETIAIDDSSLLSPAILEGYTTPDWKTYTG